MSGSDSTCHCRSGINFYLKMICNGKAGTGNVTSWRRLGSGFHFLAPMVLVSGFSLIKMGLTAGRMHYLLFMESLFPTLRVLDI